MLKRDPRAIRWLLRSRVVRASVVALLWELFALPSLPAASATGRLQWDALAKSHHAAPGETKADFDFVARNESDADIVVTAVSTSCRCTVASFATTPCRIAPHTSAVLHATIFFPRPRESVAQAVFVDSSTGRDVVRLTVDLAAANHGARALSASQLYRASREGVR